VVVTLGPAIAALGPGVYIEEIVFHDLTNNESESRLHTVEIGQILFTVTPDRGLESGGPVGGPFPVPSSIRSRARNPARSRSRSRRAIPGSLLTEGRDR